MGQKIGPRTRLSFPYSGNLWSVLDPWAGQNGYTIKQDSSSERLYQKGVGFLVAPMMLSVRSDGQQVTLEAWVRANLFVRLGALFLIPAEMGIESGGFKLVVPRNIARKAVNQLLPQLGQPPIP